MRQVGQGMSFLVNSHDEVVAEVRSPPNAARYPRKPGALEGKIGMGENFDEFPDDILAAMVGDAG